jgi:outer membrane protein TolC
VFIVKRILSWAGLFALASCAFAAGAPRAPVAPADSVYQVTVDECVRLALQNNPAMRITRATIRLTDAKVREVLAGALPDFKLNAGYTRLSNVEPFSLTLPTHPPISETVFPNIPNNYTARISVQQPIFTGLRLVSGIQEADEMSHAVRQDSARDVAALVYEVRSSYWNLFKALESKKVVDRNLEQVSAHLQDVQNRAASGLATRNDVLKVQVQQSNVQLLQVDAANAIQVSATALNNLTGLPLGTQLVPASSPDSTGSVPGPDGNLTDLIAQATADRPEVKGLEMRVRAARDQVTVARGAWYPQIMLTGDYDYARPNQRIEPPVDEFKSTWDVGIGANFEIWNWGIAGHQTAQASAQYVQAEASLAQLKDQVALDVTQDFLGLQSAKERVVVTAQAVEQTTENLAVAQAGYKVGTLLSSDLLDAEVALLQAQLNRTQALADLEVARARLQKTLGSEQ